MLIYIVKKYLYSEKGVRSALSPFIQTLSTALERYCFLKNEQTISKHFVSFDRYQRRKERVCQVDLSHSKPLSQYGDIATEKESTYFTTFFCYLLYWIMERI